MGLLFTSVHLRRLWEFQAWHWSRCSPTYRTILEDRNMKLFRMELEDRNYHEEWMYMDILHHVDNYPPVFEPFLKQKEMVLNEWWGFYRVKMDSQNCLHFKKDARTVDVYLLCEENCRIDNPSPITRLPFDLTGSRPSQVSWHSLTGQTVSQISISSLYIES